MERNEGHSGTYGWAAIGLFVLAFDYLSEESLTHAFHRGIENPRSRAFVLGTLAVTSLHLLDLIPHSPVELDPFYLLIDRVRPYDVPDTPDANLH